MCIAHNRLTIPGKMQRMVMLKLYYNNELNDYAKEFNVNK
jgi:hypothetical protein